MSAEKQLQKNLQELKEKYRFAFGSDEGKAIIDDLEKRCHYHTTTNIKGDSHESAYLEGQRSVLLFIKSNASKRRMKMSSEQIPENNTPPVETDKNRNAYRDNTNP